MLKHHFENWTVCGYHNYVPDLGTSVELGQKLIGTTLEMPATVPGSVYRDLEKAGYIAPPFKDLNSLACEWVANRWWVYQAAIPCLKKISGKTYRLVFEGIDYQADIFFNGVRLGTHEGMFLTFERDVTDLIEDNGINWLVVRLHHAPDECGQIGYTSRVTHLKSRFNYKWDFVTRLVNLGLYGDVYLAQDEPVRVAEADIRPGTGDLAADFVLRSARAGNATVCMALYDGERCVAQSESTQALTIGENTAKMSLRVEKPRLWYPNGSGESYLYRLRVWIAGQEEDTYEYPVGFRTLAYRRAEGAGEDAYPYMPVINGKPIYIKGLNFVPLDLRTGCASEEQYRSILHKIRCAGVNLLRVWGGGLLETELFYDLCDEYGIMVWQEFPMSSAGCDNVASKNSGFVEKLCEACKAAILVKRNHVSLTFWSGGNELCSEDFVGADDRNDHPADFSDSTIAALRDLVLAYDPAVQMLPTSASGPLSFLNLDRKGENHDVHGPWQYGCDMRGHYFVYNESDSMLHSEFGCDGMSCLESLPQFLSPENLEIIEDTRENLVWRHHGGEWWDTYPVREKEFFGTFTSDELPALICCSQFLQAEGIRYAVQANRRRKPQNVGSIIWQCNEPWPNICCTSVMDYYQREKLAYYFLADAYRTVDPSMRYERLNYAAGDAFTARLFTANDGVAVTGRLRCVLRADGQERVLFDSELCVPEDGVAEAGAIAFTVEPEWKDSFTVTVSFGTAENEYLFLIADEAGLYSKNAVAAYYARQMEAHKGDPRFAGEQR